MGIVILRLHNFMKTAVSLQKEQFLKTQRKILLVT